MSNLIRPVVDLSALPIAALERYANHYGLQVSRQDRSRSLLQVVQQHFAHSPQVNEAQALIAFERANAGSREYLVDDPPPTIKRRSSMHETPRKQKKARALTYGDMISAALQQLPFKQGTLDEICDLIEKQYSKQLNHELESGRCRQAVATPFPSYKG